ncbi:uncharacterized protein LOC132803576 [Ziziphus jujuba]|uniref:Uncharacterized protein LOC132803576 n=1 Tax=Ziziphus jujuba TaxID=326968 RepID=A0ABM4A7T2_ZIZJJ|nr:uncharacterized protein LOC132803576 [Ziziphus jujuba]
MHLGVLLNPKQNLRNQLIIIFLGVSDLCALGSCSQFWRGICGSDCLWKSLTRERWPFSDSSQGSSSSSSSTSIEIPISKGWKSYYIKKHNEMVDRVAEVVEFVRRSPTSESIQVGDYLRAIDNLHSMQLGFKDVQLNFFQSKA